jgi:hypothetical protein
MNRRDFLKSMVALSILSSTPLGLDIQSLDLDDSEESYLPACAWQIGGSTYPVVAMGFEVKNEQETMHHLGENIGDPFVVSRVLVDQKTTMSLSLGGVYDLQYYKNRTLPFLVWAESGLPKTKSKLQIIVEARGIVGLIDFREPTAYERNIVVSGRKVSKVQEVDILILGKFNVYYKELL